MAQIVTITNPLTGQPAQVDQLDHTAQEIDDAIARAISGGAIDIALQKKADASSVYTKTETYSKTETNTLLQTKADASSVYTKTEADALLATKAEFILLWENASPTSEFSAQTLSVNTDGCLGIIVSFVGRSTNFGSYTGSDIVNMTIGTSKMTFWQNSALVCYRGFAWNSISEISFIDAMEMSEYGNSSARTKINWDAIPYRIYGIKV